MDGWSALAGAALGLSLGLGLLASARLGDPRTSVPIIGLAISAILWGLGEALTSVARDARGEQLGVTLLYTGVCFLPPSWWLLTLRWSETHVSQYFRHPLWWRIPLAWAGLMWLAMLTNPLHGQFIEAVVGEWNRYRPLWYALALPSYLLIAASIALSVRVALRARGRRVRRQARWILAAAAVLVVTNLFAVLGPRDGPNYMVGALGAGAALVLIGVYRDGLFAVLPVALRSLVDADRDALLVARTDGSLLFANARARALFGEHVLFEGAPIPEALLSSLRDAQGAPLTAENFWSLADGRGLAARVPGESGESGERWVEMRSQRFEGWRGHAGRSLRMRDVTRDREIQLAIERGRRLEGLADLARGVAHDFANLLAIVQGNTGLLKQSLEHTPELAVFAERAHEASARAAELADQLHTYSGAIDPRREWVDLHEIARETARLFDSQAAEPVVLDLAQEPALVSADPVQLRQLVLNLLTNAREADGPGPPRLRTLVRDLVPAQRDDLIIGRDAPAGRYAGIEVEDTGPGIAPDVRDRIFDPFFSTRGQRRGLGLSIVLGIARAHGALLALSSRPETGSTFGVYFPCKPEPDQS